MALQAIRSLIQTDLAATDHFIINQLESQIPMIKDILDYIINCGGKRIRPMILLLSTRALSATAQQHISFAAVIELIHTATLLHDDVVDASTLRRGHQTANTMWGDHASVLVGDFLYSRAFQLVVASKNSAILEIFAQATPFIAEGEIMQLANSHNPDTTEEFYFDIINRKTAKLFELAAQIGGLIATSDETQITALQDFGRNLGIAYQLIDDALDYSPTTEHVGKNIGQDLAEGKTTLPLIYAMQKSRGDELKLMRSAITEGSSINLNAILGIIETTEAIKYTAATAQQYANRALTALPLLDDSPYRQALASLAEFVIRRTY